MSDFQSKWEARRRARFMRPDAARFIRPDAARFMRPDFKRYLQHDYERRFLPPPFDRKYSPDQPRDERGRWTDEGADELGNTITTEPGVQDRTDDGAESSKTFDDIFAQATRLATAGRTPAYLKCLDLCSPILELPQAPGSDLNKWNFHRCMDRCLRGN